METRNYNQQATGLQTFFNGNTGVNIGVKMINGESWFVGKDICIALELANHKDALSRLDSDERDGVGITDPMGRNQEVTVVNESGLYHLIFQSRKPEARAFRRWITSEVLPAIHRTGSYSLQSPQRQLLPAPKFRPAFIKWKERNRKFLSRKELFAIANGFRLTYSHVRKVYSGNTVSARVLDALIKAARKNREAGIEYPEHTTYERLLFEWEEMQ